MYIKSGLMDNYTIPQLRKIAEYHGVELKSKWKKEKIVDAIVDRVGDSESIGQDNSEGVSVRVARIQKQNRS